MTDVFVSYVSEDRERVRSLVAALEHAGLSVWWDQRIGAGEDWDRSIERAIRAARCVVAVMSRQWTQSRWLREEALAGLDAGKLVPVALDSVDLPLGFRTVQALRLDGRSDEEAQSAVVAAVREFLKRAAQPTAEQSAEPALAKRASIAVLPFTNLTASEDTIFFVAGVHEDLLAKLARVEGLDVISRTTAVALAQMKKTMREIAKEFGVTHVLEGGVRRAGDRVRISVQLIEAAADRQVWNQTYDRQLIDIFAVQDELAHSIAEQLRVRLDPVVGAGFGKAQTTSIEAYDCLLKADREFHQLGNTASALSRIQLLRRAIDLDPNYANAYGALAMSCGFAARLQRPPPDVGPSAMIRYAQKALEIDPSEPKALVAMAWIAGAEHGHPFSAATLPYIARGLAAHPGNAMLHELYGNRTASWRERELHWTEAYRLDPLEPSIARNCVTMLVDQDRGAETTTVVKRVVEAWPDNPHAIVGMAAAYLANDDPISALRQLKRAFVLTRVDLENAFVVVDLLAAVDCMELASRWVGALEGYWSVGSRRAFLVADRDAELAAWLDRWEAEAPNSRLADYYRAHLGAHVAGRASEGDGAAVSATEARRRLDEALARFERVFTSTAAVPARGGRIGRERSIDSDWCIGYLRYATAARKAGNAALVERLDARLRGFFADEVAPTAMPFERALFAALRDHQQQALDLFDAAARRHLWCEPALRFLGVLDDRDAVFHRIEREPRFQELRRAQRAKTAELVERIAREIPDLLDPDAVVRGATAAART